MDFYFAMLVTLKRERALLPSQSQPLAKAAKFSTQNQTHSSSRLKIFSSVKDARETSRFKQKLLRYRALFCFILRINPDIRHRSAGR